MNHAQEIASKKRFSFGKNWNAYLESVNQNHIASATASFQEMMQVESLLGKRFLDIGSGSGMSSLVAHLLGADVYSFDYDPQSTACTQTIRERFGNGKNWQVSSGSILDQSFLDGLGKFDIVYSWGVLHHTGAMWQAIDNAAALVKDKGLFFIAIYNDQGLRSKLWLVVKKFFNFSWWSRSVVIGVFFPYFFITGFVADVLQLKNPFTRFKNYHKRRGMSLEHDWLDWLGGLPFECASAGALNSYMAEKGFAVKHQKTTRRLGCHELVYEKSDA